MPKRRSTTKKPSENTTPITSVAESGNGDAKASQDARAEKLPIVGLGASAGGLEALKSFFAQVSENSGMAYIVLVHMNPNQPSILPDLLQKASRIPVAIAKDGQSIEPDRVYVVPPDKEISLFKGKIQLLDILTKRTALPIDLFFRSLAQDQGRNAAAIILSGTGTDGTLGVKAIKANDGLILVQNDETAGYDGMPRSAISTGLVDLVLPPEAMPERLVQYFAHHEIALDSGTAATKTEQQGWLNKIFAILRTRVGHDFSDYKPSTILRRISRRMGLNQIESHEHYVRFLRENTVETEALFRDLLIGVTQFFRDAESFEVLKTDILPDHLKRLGEGAVFRAWVPGCATGEEVFSLAIVLHECLDQVPGRINLQLFGTDIDSQAIDKAREGIFPASIEADVSADRLQRFFIKEGDFFRVRKEIRDDVVFSLQDVLKDPPFSRLNLLCCRNLLIYLDANAQKRLLPLFHYTLSPGGILVLGCSETISGFTNLFGTRDNKWKIYERNEVPRALRQMVHFPSGRLAANTVNGTAPVGPAPRPVDMARMTQQAILDQFAPTAILINPEGTILYVQGRTGKYLETPSGAPTHNILSLAREGLRIELSSAIRQAVASDKPVTRRNITVKINGDLQMLDLHVSPQRSPKELSGHLLVVFEGIDAIATPPAAPAPVGKNTPVEESRFLELEQELLKTRNSHQTTIEELESSNEELKSANEELQSANEELQSTNEELESSREELQSLNEELQTVNAELQSKVEELSATHDDMHNLLNSTQIATIFVDNNLHVRRFTQKATTMVNLIETDIGRPLRHVVTNLAYDGLIADLTDVLNNLVPQSCEVQTINGDWYNMRIVPYRAMGNRIDGAVLTFAAIGDQKKAQAMLDSARREMERALMLTRSVFDMNPDPIAVLDSHGRVVIANAGFAELLEITEKEVNGLDLVSAELGCFASIDLKSKLQVALKKNEDFATRPFEMKSPKEAQRFVIRGRIIKVGDHSPYRILLHFVTQQRK
ncbi:chemotaxis protein CheB [Desulfosarcina sp.]|uniref:chemotaxis protein CheB n=1 Tax=Desulfosarcina sp. TaxID=2027861 RepID=UPI00356A9D07